MCGRRLLIIDGLVSFLIYLAVLIICIVEFRFKGAIFIILTIIVTAYFLCAAYRSVMMIVDKFTSPRVKKVKFTKFGLPEALLVFPEKGYARIYFNDGKGEKGYICVDKALFDRIADADHSYVMEIEYYAPSGTLINVRNDTTKNYKK